MDLNVGSSRISANGGDVCGDAAGWWMSENQAILAIADGLGHGHDAAEAAGLAMEYIAGHLSCDITALFAGLNQSLRRSRGAAVAVARIDVSACQLTYAGIGNTRCAILGWRVTRLTGDVGIVGGGFRRLIPVTVPFRPGDCLALWTDGLPENLSFTPAAGLSSAGLAELACSILRTCEQGLDDACLMLAQATAVHVVTGDKNAVT